MVSGNSTTIQDFGCSNIHFGERCQCCGLLYKHECRTRKGFYFLLSFSVNLNYFLNQFFFFHFRVKESKSCHIYIATPLRPSLHNTEYLMTGKLFQRSVIIRLSEMRNWELIDTERKLFSMWNRCSFQLFAEHLTSSIRLRVPEIQKC